MNEKKLPLIDLSLAQRVAGEGSSAALLFFIIHLSIASRQGHLCITQQEPHPKDLWPMVTEEHFDWDELAALITKGAAEIPSNSSIIEDQGCYYFKRYWQDETSLVQNFQRLCSANPTFDINSLKTDHLLPEQALAVENCAKHMISIISGGPGTGKTYTIAQFLNQLPDTIKVALAAPTGKAAANLKQKVVRENVQAYTLHSLLGITKGQYEVRKIPADVIIIDECSMVDARVMQNLFAAVKTGARLILIGDPFQLPPVEAGSLFGDLIEALPHLTTELKKCLRAESKEIIDIASTVNQGLQGLPFLDIETFSYPELPDCTLENIGKFRILSPLKRGKFGVNRINQYYLKRALSKMQGKGPHAFPILITGNDHRMELYNGELGVLIRNGSIKDLQLRKGDYALFPGRKIPALLLPDFDYAYCLSVHKSQGSEFDHVAMLLPPGSQHFGRKVLYTGVTRAKKKLEIWSNQETINQTVAYDCRRMSGLKNRLKEL